MSTMSEQTPEPVLAVRDLSVGTRHTGLVHDVTFELRRGERVGLIGESGSGKSLTALSVIGLLSDGIHATGDVRLAGFDGNLLTARESRLSRLRGKDIAMVFQEPMTALNPTMRVGAQVTEVMRIHRTRSKRDAQQHMLELLEQVGLPEPAVTARAYPHQLSGGQRQRVVLAIALANDPTVLICDEPTTALDVTVQARVLDQIVDGVESRDAAMLFITHDLAVVSSVCERVMVMYGGRIVEAGTVTDVFTRPRHRYTQGLLAASNLTELEGGRVHTIPGAVPPAGRFPSGCVFRNRCGHADAACEVQPSWSGPSPESGYACHHPALVGQEALDHV